MKYSYTIKEIDIQGLKKIFFALQEGLEPITRFINTDIGGESGAHFYIDKINRVLNGELSVDTISGNSCVLNIKPDLIDVEEMFFSKKVVSIETIELISLIEAFVKESNNYQDSLTT